MKNTVKNVAADYKRHGGPYDRGSADCYYKRPYAPHYYEGDSYSSRLVLELTPEQIEQYRAGWNFTRSTGKFKQY